MQKSIYVLLLAILAVSVISPIPAQAAPPSTGQVEVSSAVYSDVSAPVRDLTGFAPTSNTKDKNQKPLRSLPNMGNALNQPDGALQTSVGPSVATSTGLSFAGVGNGDYGFIDLYAPPDTNGVVGATQYVQWVNTSFAVFDKSTGAIAPGFPKLGNSVWSGFGGGCQTNNDGDPIVQYDKAANRWILTQFSVSTTPYLQCLAISTTADATGSYYRYAFSYGTTQFPDYPKLGVWPDGYYISYNIFNNGVTFGGSKVCAFDRSKMLVGDPTATQQCFQLSSNFGGLLPSDLDGITAPPAGSPNFFLNFGSNSLNLWKFHVDFANSANTTLTGPINIPVASFSPACSGGGTCIPQPGTSQQLDSLADRLMYRLAYRNFGDHEALVVNHSVTAGSSVGVRWYEIRNPNGTPTVFQQGTYAPDSNYRWMGSIAMDKVGDIALGYSVSSSSLQPSIRYTGRTPGDPLGTLQAENTVITGSGSQTGGLNRWGDYSAMAVDPVDDCTFWYTNEYLKVNGSFNWSTQIISFKFPSCSSTPPALTTITVSPSTASVVAGGTQQFTATGYDQFGNPMSPQPTFTWSVSGGGTISSSGLFTAGSTAGGPFTVTASSGSVSGTASVTVTALPVLTTITVTPSTASVVTGGSQQFTATGYDQFGKPVSPQPTFTWSVSGGGTISSSGLFTAGSTAGGPFTVTASSGSVIGTASVTVTARPVLTTITVSPSTASVVTGGSQQFTAMGYDQFGNPVSPQPTFTWAVSGGGTISSSGLFTAGSTAGGPFTVTASSSSVSSTASVTVTVSPNVIMNGGFETGSLVNWTSAGATGVVSSGAHSGTYAAILGRTTPTLGNSSIAQTFAAPSTTSPTLSFWYNLTCPDTVNKDWATARLRDNTTGTNRTILPKVCTNGAGWKLVSTTLTTGHSYTLTLYSHDDNVPTNPTFTLYDDVVVR